MKVLVIGTNDIEFDDFFEFFKNDEFLDLSKARNSLGQIQNELDKLLDD